MPACAPTPTRDFGGAGAFAGRAHTVKVFENNPLVRKVRRAGRGRVLAAGAAACSADTLTSSPPHKHAQAVTSPGEGRVLVVDGGGSLRCALLGDMLGEAAAKNGWAVGGRQPQLQRIQFSMTWPWLLNSNRQI